MNKIKREVIVPYQQKQMFNLVADVNSYPLFMPWCGGSEIIHSDANGVEAAIIINLAGIKQRFVTRNTYLFYQEINLELIEGPFSFSSGNWIFKEVEEKTCKIIFDLQYSFSNKILELLIGPVFNRISNNFIDSFAERAKKIYK